MFKQTLVYSMETWYQFLYQPSDFHVLLDMQDYALKVITETNESWAKLVKRNIAAGELSLVWDDAPLVKMPHFLLVL